MRQSRRVPVQGSMRAEHDIANRSVGSLLPPRREVRSLHERVSVSGGEAGCGVSSAKKRKSIAPASPPCRFCGAPLAPHGVTRREGHFIVWYAACVECKRKEESQ